MSAFLFATRQISAAIFGSNITTWSKELFIGMLQYTGDTLMVLSIISLIIGIIYLISAEMGK